MFNWVQVRGIWWQIFQRVPGGQYGLPRVSPLVKACVIHDQNSPLGQLWDQVVHQPQVEDVRIYIAGRQADAKECCSQQSPDHIGAATCVPVVSPKTALASWCISVSAGHIMSKAALIYVNDRPAVCFMGSDPGLK